MQCAESRESFVLLLRVVDSFPFFLFVCVCVWGVSMARGLLQPWLWALFACLEFAVPSET